MGFHCIEFPNTFFKGLSGYNETIAEALKLQLYFSNMNSINNVKGKAPHL